MKPTIFPFLRYTDAPAAIEWLGRAFLFEKQVAFPDLTGRSCTRSSDVAPV